MGSVMAVKSLMCYVQTVYIAHCLCLFSLQDGGSGDYQKNIKVLRNHLTESSGLVKFILLKGRDEYTSKCRLLQSLPPQ